ncbi:dimethylamine monooxygenase subunit DmmA family protein [Cryptosporangium arvum]|uniref:dimethylamine monooxygenase subunit DmmA family protein n=1 Tax=Cryptosporangium arvum TaxID=80871 RepID=UPI00055CE94B|nr:dimethylamine monooxygenase subunit DmmA family protein [Cryptosporangium arvum]
MGAPHTSVPRWPTTDPGIDESGRAYAVMAFGGDAAGVAAGWCERIRALARPLWVRRCDRADDDALAALAGRLRVVTVGWRLLLAGPEIDVLRAHAVALDGGALDAELRILVTDDRRRRVRCAHCTATTEADVRPDEQLRCAGCARTLVVHAHVSRVHAAYLGSAG